MTREYLLKSETVSKAVLKLSTPSSISTLSTVIYNIIDTIFIGKYVGLLGIAAISIYLPIQMMISSFALLFASGIGVYISKELGAKNKLNCNKALGTLIACILTFIIILVPFGLIFTKPIVEFFGASSAVIPLAKTYAKLMFLSALFNPLCLASNNVLRGEGATKYSMNGILVSISLNIFLDFIFISVLHLGIFGAGLATFLAKLSNFLYILYFFKYKSILKIEKRFIRYNFHLLRKTILIGFSTFLNQFAGSVSIILLNKDLLFLGGNFALALYGIIYKLTSFIQKSVGGFSRGVQPLIGYNFGAKNYKRLLSSLKYSLLYSTILAFTLTLLVSIFSKSLLSLFTHNKVILASGNSILRLALLASPFLGIYFVSISFFRAILKVKESILLSLFRRVIFFIPFLYILPFTFHLKLYGIWILLPLSNFLSFFFASTLLFISIKKLKKC